MIPRTTANTHALTEVTDCVESASQFGITRRKIQTLSRSGNRVDAIRAKWPERD